MSSATIFAVLLSLASGFHYAASRRLFSVGLQHRLIESVA
jgi:hypothetical protein